MPNTPNGSSEIATEPTPNSERVVLPVADLRDYFAAKALQGMCASEFWPVYLRGFREGAKSDDGAGRDAAVKEAYAIADAMLKAREA